MSLSLKSCKLYFETTYSKDSSFTLAQGTTPFLPEPTANAASLFLNAHDLTAEDPIKAECVWFLKITKYSSSKPVHWYLAKTGRAFNAYIHEITLIPLLGSLPATMWPGSLGPLGPLCCLVRSLELKTGWKAQESFWLCCRWVAGVPHTWSSWTEVSTGEDRFVYLDNNYGHKMLSVMNHTFEIWYWKVTHHPFALILIAWGMFQLRSSPLSQRVKRKFTDWRLACIKMPGTPGTKSAPGVSKHTWAHM